MGLIDPRLEGLDSFLQHGDSPRKIILQDRYGRYPFCAALDLGRFCGGAMLRRSVIRMQVEFGRSVRPIVVIRPTEGRNNVLPSGVIGKTDLPRNRPDEAVVWWFPSKFDSFLSISVDVYSTYQLTHCLISSCTLCHGQRSVG